MIKSLPMILVIFMLGLAGQDQPELGARGIFDSQTKVTVAPNTEVKSRTYTPKRTRSRHTASADRPKVAENNAALKYSLLAQGHEPPKGYRYSNNLLPLTKDSSGRVFGITDPQQNFKEGERIKLVFEVSKPGYLYILNIGSDGETKTLFYPAVGKDASVTPDAPVVIGPLKIDPPAGVDRLTVLFTSQPIISGGSRNLSPDDEAESEAAPTVAEEEIYSPTKQTTSLYFANQAGQSGIIKAEIDILHTR